MKKKKTKKFKEIYIGRVFVIRSSQKWIAGITHSGLGANLSGEDKIKEMALVKLCERLYQKIIEISQNGKERYF